jgi:hypothetical protein
LSILQHFAEKGKNKIQANSWSRPGKIAIKHLLHYLFCTNSGVKYLKNRKSIPLLSRSTLLFLNKITFNEGINKPSISK